MAGQPTTSIVPKRLTYEIAPRSVTGFGPACNKQKGNRS